MSKHTKGPWKQHASNRQIVVDDKGFGVAELYTQNNEVEHEANARLISSAPEMLEALHSARIVLHNSAPDSMGYQLVLDAIKKAEGNE